MSYHGSFFGRSGTGKTWKARKLAATFRRSGVPVLALTPPNQEAVWVEANWATADVDRFVARAMASRGCALFMELSDSGTSKYDDRIERLFTFGRHLGHRCFFVAQRFNQVSPTVREQCAFLWLFKTGPKATATLAEEFADPLLLQAAGLPDRCFMFKEGNAPARRVNC